ncbi:ricin-type beta-trefoil lectin domain protein [Streptomyces sp. ISL-12]|uniref:RICIN domain-containing protein n=1 Tax=Streptomyces sp. ISL-12 TaxID=2819177 RepID=UPI001BE5177A|nr:RICIN domain-containing protein [Streptomyces sp. ISL-12]MBT2412011.1 ricin-type beta-trefoil lectin domain protein [Streptomyces sp. ISL-12]
MPRQNEPPSSETAPPVTVRRAVAVPGPAQDPGAALGPRVPAPEPTPAPVAPAPTASAPDPGPELEPAPAATSAPAGKRFGKPRWAEQEQRPETKSPAEPETEPEVKSGTKPGTRPGTASKAERKTASEAQPGAKPEAEAKAEPEAAPSPLAAAATAAEAEATAAGASQPADQHPSRPRRPLLAAAGIAGALLISVPFLVLAAIGDDDDRSIATAPVGGTTLGPGTSDDELPADYAAESPSPSPSASKASPSAKSPSPAEVKAAPQGTEEKTAAEEEKKTKEPAAGKTTKAARTEKKATTKKTPEPTARELANAASSQSAVLLKNTATGKCADVPGYGTGSVDGPVRQYICRDGSSDNQQWDLNVVSASGGPGGASLFVIKNVKDGLCFDLPKYGSVGKGTQVTEFPCNTTRSDNHLWYLEPRAGGTYALRNLVANLCLGVNGGKTAGDDAELQVMTCGENQYTAQRWVFS